MNIHVFPEGTPIATTIPITISGTIINFPVSGSSPNWSEAVIDFAVAVQDALASFVGPFDIPPQIYIMVSNVNANVNIPNLTFPTSRVQGAEISYSVFRNTSTQTVSESGSILINYNATAATGSKWEIAREYVGDAQITFTITDTGQLQFSTTLLSGTAFNGKISYQAKAILSS